MSDNPGKASGFDAAKSRLEEIADAVSSDDISLDEALDLFEEAVSLGLKVGDVLEADIDVAGAMQATDADDAAPDARLQAQEASS